jgi:DNA-directed RNA polymerase subunit RPC12/RpoP
MSERPTPLSPRQPPPGRQFPCLKCGARLDFDPAASALHCPYCGYTQPIAPADRAVCEHDFQSEVQYAPETTLPGHSCEVRCGACGAIVLLEDKVATDRCPYCGSHLENKPQAAQAMIAPEAVLPFTIDERRAVAAFTAWINSRWFAPNELKKLANLGRLDGVYVPFWTFDSMTYTHYTGQRGDDYQEVETYTERDAQGNLVTRQRTVMRTRWYPVAGQVQHFFDDVLVRASTSIPEHFVRAWMPHDLHGLEPFRPDFLSGFKTERYTIGPREGFTAARQIMDQTIRQLCCQQIGGNHQQLHTVQTQHVGVTFKHVLLPTWLASYRYRGQAYRVLINGRTGAVQGDRPYSWLKITLLVLLILTAILAVVLAIRWANRPGRVAQPLPVQSVPAALARPAAAGSIITLTTRANGADLAAPHPGDLPPAGRRAAAGLGRPVSLALGHLDGRRAVGRLPGVPGPSWRLLYARLARSAHRRDASL